MLTLALFAGCSTNRLPAEASSALQDGSDFELFSLEPSRRVHESNATTFHDWAILGATKVTDPATREVLIDALKAGVAENSNGMAAACFEPRHGIRVMHDGEQHDFVIFFECYQGQWYTGDERKEGFLLTKSPQPAFDRVLRDASVQLAAPLPD